MRAMIVSTVCAIVAAFGIGVIMPPNMPAPIEPMIRRGAAEIEPQRHASARLGKLLDALRLEDNAFAETAPAAAQEAPLPRPPAYDAAKAFRRSLRAVLQGDGAGPAVLLVQRGGAPRRVFVGDAFERGWTIADISAQAVTLRRGREVVRVSLWSLASLERAAVAPGMSVDPAQNLQEPSSGQTQSTQSPRLLLSRPGSRRNP